MTDGQAVHNAQAVAESFEKRAARASFLAWHSTDNHERRKYLRVAASCKRKALLARMSSRRLAAAYRETR